MPLTLQKMSIWHRRLRNGAYGTHLLIEISTKHKENPNFTFCGWQVPSEPTVSLSIPWNTITLSVIIFKKIEIWVFCNVIIVYNWNHCSYVQPVSKPVVWTKIQWLLQCHWNFFLLCVIGVFRNHSCGFSMRKRTITLIQSLADTCNEWISYDA